MAKHDVSKNGIRIGVTGIVSDQFGSVLAIKRDDSRTWCPPGGSMDVGELPPECTAREVEEETGLKVMPIRLVGVEYLNYADLVIVGFTFRCLKRGGGMQTSAESLEVGMIPRAELDNIPMSSFHRARTLAALTHSGETPALRRVRLTPRDQFIIRLVRTVVYPYKNLRRKMWGGEEYVPPPLWDVSVSAVITNDKHETLWTADGALPNGSTAPNEAPWETIERLVDGVELVDLAAVYVDETRPMMHLVWIGRLNDVNDAPNDCTWRNEPMNADSVWGERWTDTSTHQYSTTQFIRTQL